MADTIDHNISCNICGETNNLKRCGICKCTYYCSREHQLKDWALHKQVCETFKTHLPTNNKGRVSGGMVDGKSNKDGLVKEDFNKGNVNADRNSNQLKGLDKENVHIKNGDNLEDVTPFDRRPFRSDAFISMQAHANKQDVAKIAVNNLNEKGYCVIDGLFTRNKMKKALKDINKCMEDNRFNSGKLGGGRTSGEHEKQEVNADIRSDKIMWLEGTEEDVKGITSIVSRMDSILWEFNKFLDKKYFINGRTKAMVACYPGNGSYYRRHVDNPHGDGRVVTCILYLNEGWNVQEDGGLLRILPEDSDDHVDIAPVANRLLFFWCDRRNPHEVQPAYKTRYAITVWYMDEEERRRAKLECKAGEMTKVRGEYVLQERQQRQEERDKLNQKIEDAATDAIASLSMDELKAISDLIAGQPNSEDTLASMGIAPNIRTKLMQKLQNLKTES
ncbi:egl nine homolog 1-like [Mercenaria mercenaria]|uniref:egl nine homolog 1-like n=1 Tax=Mercenaria mercenaria TaxID=6596 RepID=UPI00234E4323|nr:egl nine homolog 1-like [Mercenaria mercenaria]